MELRVVNWMSMALLAMWSAKVCAEDDCTRRRANKICVIESRNDRSSKECKSLLIQQCESFSLTEIYNETTLDVLEITKTEISSLPSKAFSGLSDLWQLSLYENKLSALESDTFFGVDLQRLALCRNQLSDLPQNVFSNLTKLFGLFLRQNRLRSLPPGIFTGLRNLKYLDISENQITVVQADMFIDLESLVGLSMQNNELTELPDGLFEKVNTLRHLSLNSNKLTELRHESFKGLTSLKELIVSDNELTTLEDTIFSDMPSLIIIKLENNSLSRLPKHDAEVCPLIRVAFFNENNIAEVTEEVLRTWLAPVNDTLPVTKRSILQLENNALQDPSAFRWAVEDPNIDVRVHSECNCGTLMQSRRRVTFCFNMNCPYDSASDSSFKDWVEAAQAG